MTPAKHRPRPSLDSVGFASKEPSRVVHNQLASLNFHFGQIVLAYDRL